MKTIQNNIATQPARFPAISGHVWMRRAGLQLKLILVRPGVCFLGELKRAVTSHKPFFTSHKHSQKKRNRSRFFWLCYKPYVLNVTHTTFYGVLFTPLSKKSWVWSWRLLSLFSFQMKTTSLWRTEIRTSSGINVSDDEGHRMIINSFFYL